MNNRSTKYLVRWAFSPGRKQKRVIECVTKVQSRNSSASEIRDDDKVGGGGTVLHEVSTGGKGDIYNSINKPKGRSTLEKYVRGEASVCNRYFCGRDLFGLVGFVDHEGVSRYWNSERGCWLPIYEETSTAC
jgi:hypothetical protein